MPRTIKTVRATEAWRDNLRNSSVKVGFGLMLSKAMIEYLCGVADDVTWDRGLYWKQGSVENWIAPQTALVKRGLIERKTDDELERTRVKDWETWDQACEYGVMKLTPAGEVVVQLLKLAGVFVEQDAAINKKAKRRA